MSTTVVSRNSWRLVSKLGSGTFGSVWYAVHFDLDSVCAVKVVSTATFLRFKQRTSTSLTESSEFNTLRALEHPHVQCTLGYEADTDFVRVYLDYLPGRAWIDSLIADGPLEQGVTMLLFSQFFDALIYLRSRGVIHRDLKPDNLMITTDDRVHLTLIDFGLARDVDAGCWTRVGSTFYMAPEVSFITQMCGLSGYDMAADLWSAGICLYVCWVACSPWPDSWCPRFLVDSFRLDFSDEEWRIGRGGEVQSMVEYLTAWLPGHRFLPCLTASK